MPEAFSEEKQWRFHGLFGRGAAKYGPGSRQEESYTAVVNAAI